MIKCVSCIKNEIANRKRRKRLQLSIKAFLKRFHEVYPNIRIYLCESDVCYFFYHDYDKELRDLDFCEYTGRAIQELFWDHDIYNVCITYGYEAYDEDGELRIVRKIRDCQDA